MSYSFLTKMKNQTTKLNQTTNTVVEAISGADSLVHFRLTVRVSLCVCVCVCVCIYIYIYIYIFCRIIKMGWGGVVVKALRY